MTSKCIALVGILFSIAGCVTVPPMQLQPGARNVQVAKADPGDNYEIIGPVSGFDGSGCGGFGYKGSYERATTSLRNRTLAMGGNYAQLISLTEPHLTGDCFVNEFAIRATAYKKVRDRPSPTPIVETGAENLPKKLRELKSLLDEGILLQQEYDVLKARLLEKGFEQ